MGKKLSEMTLEELWWLFPIILREYNPAWAEWYKEEAALLQRHFGSKIQRIRHIGSTSVPGLSAKPTVDILLETDTLCGSAEARRICADCGYTVMCESEEPSWQLDLCKGYTNEGFAERVFHLHIRYLGDWDEPLFCEYLRHHPECAAQYAELKKSLKERFEHNRDAYTDAKSDFVKTCSAAARKELDSFQVLHIFNGDCAYEKWKETTGGSDAYIVWRENYLEGPLPGLNVPEKDFYRIRAEFLHDCVPQYSEEQLYHFLYSIEERVKNLTCFDTVVLWFDACMFDMLMLSRILYVLKGTKAEIRLFSEDVVLPCHPEIFRLDYRTFRKLDAETISVYADAWTVVVSGPEAVNQYSLSGRADKEKYLADAMKRYSQDHPVGGGMGRSQRRLLDLIGQGVTEWPEIFMKFDEPDTTPFMGDTTCFRMLEDLENQGYISMQRMGEKVKLSLLSRK